MQRLELRISSYERQVLAVKAANRGLSVADYIRHKLDLAPGRAVGRPRKPKTQTKGGKS